MFNVELNDEGLEMAHEIFGVTPVLVYSQWANYTGTCVWRCNQYSTYSLPGEPSDARYTGLFDDGVFSSAMVGENFTSPTMRLWGAMEAKFPERFAERMARHKRATEFDQETMFVYGAMVSGGVAKKDDKGDWTIEHPEDKPRKKFLGVF